MVLNLNVYVIIIYIHQCLSTPIYFILKYYNTICKLQDINLVKSSTKHIGTRKQQYVIKVYQKMYVSVGTLDGTWFGFQNIMGKSVRNLPGPIFVCTKSSQS